MPDEIPLDEAIDTLADKFGVPRTLWRRLVGQESGGNVDVGDSSKGAKGLFQIMPGTARNIRKPDGSPINPNDPLEAAYGGLKLLSDNYKQFRPRAQNDRHAWGMALAGYHGSPRNVFRDLERGGLGIPDQDDGAINTQDYVANILRDVPDVGSQQPAQPEGARPITAPLVTDGKPGPSVNTRAEQPSPPPVVLPDPQTLPIVQEAMASTYLPGNTPAGNTPVSDIPAGNTLPKLPTRRRPAPSADDLLVRAAVRNTGKLASDLQWHFGDDALDQLNRVNPDQRRQMISIATRAAAEDLQKKAKGEQLSKSVDYQNENRARVGLPPVARDTGIGTAPGSPLAGVFKKPQETNLTNLSPAAMVTAKSGPLKTGPVIADQGDDAALRRQFRDQIIAERAGRQQGPMTQARAGVAMAESAQSPTAVNEEVERRLQEYKRTLPTAAEQAQAGEQIGKLESQNYFQRIWNQPTVESFVAKARATLARDIGKILPGKAGERLTTLADQQQSEARIADMVQNYEYSGNKSALRRIGAESSKLAFTLGPQMLAAGATGVPFPLIAAGASYLENGDAPASDRLERAGVAYLLAQAYTKGPAAAVSAAAKVSPRIARLAAEFPEITSRITGGGLFGAAGAGETAYRGGSAEDILVSGATAALPGIALGSGKRLAEELGRIPEAAIRAEWLPEPVRTAAAKAKGYQPVIVQTDETNPRFASVYYKSAKEQYVQEITPEQAKEFNRAARGEKARPFITVEPSEFDRVAGFSTSTEAEKSATVQPMNRQIEEKAHEKPIETPNRPTDQAPPAQSAGTPAAQTIREGVQAVSGPGEKGTGVTTAQDQTKTPTELMPDQPTPKVGEPVSHPNPEISGKPIVATTEDGRAVVENPNNKTGISVVKHQPESAQSSQSVESAGVKGTRETLPGEKHPVTGRKFSSTQVNLPPAEAKLQKQAAAEIPGSELAEDGRESDAHVTVKYGVHDENPKAIQDLLADEGPITATVGKVSIFPAKEGADYDVVKMDIDSPGLHRLNAKIAKGVKVTDTHPEYKPHVTLAYVKPGEGQKYVGRTNALTGKQITFDKLLFSSRSGEEVEIPLKAKEVPGEQQQSTEVAKAVSKTQAIGEAEAAPVKPKASATPDQSGIVNPIDRNASQEEKVKQLQALSRENGSVVRDLLDKIKSATGLEGTLSHKLPERILAKANRPEIKDRKPWFDVEHVRDALRFKAPIQNFEQFADIAEVFAEDPRVEIVKTDTDKMIAPKEWGWRLASFDIRLPNGQIVEFYSPFAELDAKDVKGPNHELFEKWRGKTAEEIAANYQEYYADLETSFDRYNAAYQRALDRLGLSESEAAASWKSVEARLASSTRSKLSLRSSAEKAPTVQAPSTLTAGLSSTERLEGPGKTITRPVAGSTETIGPPLSEPIETSTSIIRPGGANVPAGLNKKDAKRITEIDRKISQMAFADVPADTANSIVAGWRQGRERILARSIDSTAVQAENGPNEALREQLPGATGVSGEEVPAVGPVGDISARPVEGGGETGAVPERVGASERSGAAGEPGTSDAQEADSGRDELDVSGRDSEERVSEPEPTAVERTVKASQNQKRNALLRRDYRIDPEKLDFGGKKEKFRLNVAAIRTMRQILAEGRDYATPEEQEKLVRYVGWGGLPEVFNRWQTDAKWKREHDEVKQLLGGYEAEEYQRAMESTKNAHFTSPEVVGVIWRMLERLGFKGGRMLEPGVGSGNFFGMMPADIHGNRATTLKGIDIDPLTGQIARLLYPSASINIQGYQDYSVADNYFDLAASNVPFSDTIQIADKRYAHLKPMLHDYYFLKSLDKVRPGGLVAFITSTGTMDRGRTEIRAAISEKADLIAAFRLPDTAFKKNAGTEVTTDLIILRKKIPGDEEFTANHWIETKETKVKGGKIALSEYYVAHPENMLGIPALSQKMYGPGSERFALHGTDDFPDRLEKALSSLPENLYRPYTRERSEEIRFPAPDEIKQGALFVRDGKLFRKDRGELVSQEAPPAQVGRVEQMIQIRQAIRTLFLTELSQGQSAVAKARVALNKAYDTFVKKYGFLNQKENAKAFDKDPDAPVLLKLERPGNVKGSFKKAEIFSKSVVKTYDRPMKAANLGDALSIALNETARIDRARMAELLGITPDEVEQQVIDADLAFRDPINGWEVKDEYLSGNVKKKLQVAQEAAKTDPLYERNVTALEQTIKEKLPDVDYVDIDARLGANWIPATDIADFAAGMMQAQPRDFKVTYLATSGTWIAESDSNKAWYGPQAIEVWGTPRAPFIKVLQAALDDKRMAIYDKASDGSSSINREATEAANAKVKELKSEFKDWIWQDDERRQRLHRYYNDNFVNMVNRQFVGQHLTLAGLSEEWQKKLHPHVKDAVWRIINNGKALIAYEVGTGKTAIMAISAMELKRLGLVRKPMIATLNSALPGIAAEVREMYPNINLLVLGEKDLDAKQRNAFMADISTSDYDLIIVGHSHINMLPVLPDTQAKYLREELNELEAAIVGVQEAEGETGKDPKKSGNRVVKQLAKAKEKLEERIKEALGSKKDNVVYFEQTGVDMLYVDEAHAYKSVPVYTKRGQVKGIPTTRSDRATNMLMVTRWLQENNNNRGVVFATGTPISNSIPEIYTLQRYLQAPELKERGIDTFDAWANLYGDTSAKLEYKATGEYKQTLRFNQFSNLPELRALLGDVMDVKFADQLAGFKRPSRKDHVTSVPMSDAQWDYLTNVIRPRAEALKGGGWQKAKGDDNMLAIATDARKSAMDMRLVDQHAIDDPGSKVNEMVRKVLRVSEENPGKTQMIFTDFGIGETEWGFSLAQDIIKKLVHGGIPRAKIINFNALTDTKRGPAIRALREAKALIGIGSSQKMGTGINAQDHLLNLHHIDAPYVPAYLEQRNGRGWRMGNQNPVIYIDTYSTQKSFDVFMWQTVTNKANFIDRFMRGDITARSIRDDDTEEMSYAQIMAVTSGNPDLLFKMQLDDEVQELERGARRHQSQQSRLKDTIKDREATISYAEKGLAAATKDHELYQTEKDKPFAMTIGKKTFSFPGDAKADMVAETKKKAGRALQKAVAQWFQTREELKRTYQRQELQEHESEGALLGKYRGFEIRANPRGVVDLVGPGDEYPFTTEGEDPLTPLRSADAVLRNGPSAKIRNREESVETYKQQIDQAKAQLGRPFRDQPVLEKKRAELTAVTKKLEDAPAELQEAIAAEGRPMRGPARRAERPRLSAVQAMAEDVPRAARRTPRAKGLAESPVEERFAGFPFLRSLFEPKPRNIGVNVPPTASDFREVEERWKAAKGIKVPGALQKALEGLRGFFRSFKRHYIHLDPGKDEQTALTTDILRLHEASPAWAKAMAYDQLVEITGQLNKQAMDVFTRNLVLPDILKDIEDGLYSIEGDPNDLREMPFGYKTKAEVEQDLAKFEKLAEATPAIKEALDRRRRIAGAITKRLVDLDLLKPEVLNDDRYYHRQVLKYVNAQDFVTTGTGGGVRLSRKGFQKERAGGGDFNVRYQEAEFEWLAQAYSLIAKRETLDQLDAVNNIVDDLKRQAKALNLQQMQGPVDQDQLAEYSAKIGRANAELREMAKDGTLTSANGRFDALIDQFSNTPKRQPFNHPDWFAFLSHLMENDLDGKLQAAMIFKAIAERQRYIKEELGSRYKTWQDLVPDTHTEWQPEKGSLFFLASTVEEKALGRVLAGEKALEAEDIRNQLVMGGPKKQWAIPKELAQTLEEMRALPSSDPVENLWVMAQSSWKQWVLLNPARAVVYNFNNLSGDLDIALAYDPKILTYAKSAAADLWRYQITHKARDSQKAEIQHAIKLGVIDSGLTVIEIPDINKAGAFRALFEEDQNIVTRAVEQWWGGTKNFTTWRENALRLAAFRYFKEHKGYGASHPNEIDAIKDKDAKAAKLARELIGDYGNVSVAGQWIRRHLIPFFSWVEINAPRYRQLLRNTAQQSGEQKGKRFRFGAVTAKKIALLYLKAHMLLGLIALWNHLMFPDEEEELRREGRKPHIILGRAPDGAIRTLKFQGALADALEWFGLEDYPSDIADLLSGRKNWQDQAAETVKAPVERVVNSLEPFSKTTFELATGRQTYPHIFREGSSFDLAARPIRDRKEYAARVLSLGALYNRVTGKPVRPITKDPVWGILETFLVYRTDPGEAAYWEVRGRLSDWQEKRGKIQQISDPTERGNSLYYFKQASKWGDDKAAVKWLQRYRDLGGTDKGLVASIRSAHPLGSLARKDWDEFAQTLTPEERLMLKQSIDWYKKTYGDLPAEDGESTLQDTIDKAMEGQRGGARRVGPRPPHAPGSSKKRFGEFQAPAP